MAYARKTVDRWDIESYESGYGWSVECSEYTWEEAKEQYRCYRENCSVPVRLVKRREKISGPNEQWIRKYVLKEALNEQ